MPFFSNTTVLEDEDSTTFRNVVRTVTRRHNVTSQLYFKNTAEITSDLPKLEWRVLILRVVPFSLPRYIFESELQWHCVCYVMCLCWLRYVRYTHAVRSYKMTRVVYHLGFP